MTQTYSVSGMTCSGCQAKVQTLLANVKGVKNVMIDLTKGQVAIDMEKHISTPELAEALKDYSKYQISESNHNCQDTTGNSEPDETKSWIETYKPILLIFGYIVGVTILIEVISGTFIWHRWMGHFMAGFFLVFSFFKLLNLKGFAESYSMYDIVAKKWQAWGYVYALSELALGIAFLTAFNPLITNGVAFIVMSISIVGVLQSVLNKRRIQCACLGDVFNLPMTSITVIEDALMIAMSGIMLLTLL